MRRRPISSHTTEANFENEAGLEIGLDKEYVAGLEDGKEGDYITDVITDKSIDFIEDNKDNPFFLYLSHYVSILHSKRRNAGEEIPEKLRP